MSFVVLLLFCKALLPVMMKILVNLAVLLNLLTTLKVELRRLEKLQTSVVRKELTSIPREKTVNGHTKKDDLNYEL